MPTIFRELSSWEQEQVMKAYPHMKGYEQSFWRYYPTLEKRFWRVFGVLVICMLLFLFLVLLM